MSEEELRRIIDDHNKGLIEIAETMTPHLGKIPSECVFILVSFDGLHVFFHKMMKMAHDHGHTQMCMDMDAFMCGHMEQFREHLLNLMRDNGLLGEQAGWEELEKFEEAIGERTNRIISQIIDHWEKKYVD